MAERWPDDVSLTINSSPESGPWDMWDIWHTGGPGGPWLMANSKDAAMSVVDAIQELHELRAEVKRITADRDRWMIGCENKRMERIALVDTITTIKMLATGSLTPPTDAFQSGRDDEDAALNAVAALVDRAEIADAALVDAAERRNLICALIGARMDEPAWQTAQGISHLDGMREAMDILDGVEVTRG